MRFGFILYISRSGSTFLSAELDKHLDISVTQENHFISKVIEYGSINDEVHLIKLIDKLFMEKQFLQLGLDKNELIAKLLKRNYTSKKIICEEILFEIFKNSRSEINLIKHSPYSYISTLLEWWPDLIFIHIVRDFRAVFYSLRNFHKNLTSNPTLFENIFILSHRWKARVSAQHNTHSVYTIRYEDLIQRKNESMEKLFSYLNLDSNKYNRGNSVYASRIGNDFSSMHRNVGKEPNIKNINKWQKGLHNYEEYAINILCGKNLKKLGYECHNNFDFRVKIKAYLFLLFELIKVPLFYIEAIYNHSRNKILFHKVYAKLYRTVKDLKFKYSR